MYTIEEIADDIRAGMTNSQIYKKHGGTAPYIPKVDPKFKEKIIREFNGYNHHSLATKFNISLNTIYRVLRSAKVENNGKN